MNLAGEEQTPSAVEARLTQVFRGYEAFAKALCKGFDLAGSASGGSQRERTREIELDSLLGRVARKLAEHPRRRLLYQFVVDQSCLADGELHQLFEFIYSYLVNAFKGEVAEVLSRAVVRRFIAELVASGELPASAEAIEGKDVSSRRRTGRGFDPSWQKGADGLIGVPSDRGWVFHGVIEIKSYRQGVARLSWQLAQHVERARLGTRIRGLELDRDFSGFVLRRKQGRNEFSALSTAAPRGDVLKLAIRPRPEMRQESEPMAVSPFMWLAELPFSTRELHEAGYLLAVWYIARGAGDLFEGRVSDNGGLEGPSENPYPELPPEESGQECLRRGLYEASLRRSFAVSFLREGETVSDRKHHSRSDEVFARLYNGICFGVEFMVADHLLTPEEYRKRWNAVAETEGASEPEQQEPPPSAGDESVAKAHSRFSLEEYQDAREALEPLSESDLSPRKVRTRRWLLGMIAYRQGRFSDALSVFPGGEGAPDRFWWTRDQLMLSRLRARSGDGRGALEAIRSITDEDVSRFHALRVERPACLALAYLVSGDESERDSAIAEARRALAHLRAEKEKRIRENKGLPIDVNAASVRLGIVDMAVALAAKREVCEAAELLRSVHAVGKWLPEFLKMDPLLSSVRGEGAWARLTEAAEKAGADPAQLGPR